LQDVFDGQAFKDLQGSARADSTDFTLYVQLSTDPFQPFKDNSGYSITPFVLVLMNAPPKLRWEHGFCTTLALVPGRREQEQPKV